MISTLLAGLAAAVVAAGLDATTPFESPRFGVKVAMPTDWEVAVREREEYAFVARVPQADPDRPGAVACELALAPQSLEEYRTRIDANAARGDRPGTLVRNEVVEGPDGNARLETLHEFHPAPGVTWRELTVRVIAHRQLYAFVLNVDGDTWETARPAFEALVASAEFSPPNTGADPLDPAANRWLQREFRFALDLPEGWQPALAPAEIALLFANGPPRGIWSDNLVVVGHPHQPMDLDQLRRELPEGLRAVDPDCEVLACEVVPHGDRSALETVVRTRRGPFSMVVLERRFQGERFNYEVKYTLESERFDALAPALRRSLDSFSEVPGELPVGGKPA